MQLTPKQKKYMYSQTRFNVAPCGRRSGKTHIAKLRCQIKAATSEGLYFIAAPTYAQVKRIYWKDMKTLLKTATVHKSESDLIITIDNGSEVHLIGLDKPERIEGTPWTWGILDEFADTKAQAWDENISPALDTEGLETGADIIGVPDGLNHFFDVSEYARSEQDSDWTFHTWHSSEVLSDKKVEAAKRRLDHRTYRQEYEASFETASGRVYDNYSNNNHTTREFTPGTIYWSHDFNFLPMSSFIAQVEGDNVFAVDEIVLEHAVARDAATEFVERYKDYTQCPVILYGDASGRVGEKHGQISNYVEIETILRAAGFKVKRKVPLANPSIKDGQNSLRAKILNASGERTFHVNPAKCPILDKGLKTVQLKKGSTFIEDETNAAQHITTAARYFTNVEFPSVGRATVRIS